MDLSRINRRILLAPALPIDNVIKRILKMKKRYENFYQALDLGSHINRDREGPHGLPPPTPPDVRGTSTAVRPMQLACASLPERSVFSRGARGQVIPGVDSVRRRAACQLATPPQATPPRSRAGRPPVSPPLRCPLRTSAVRSRRMAPPSGLSRPPRRAPGGRLGPFGA
jgi:hypothetical protein